MGKALVAFFVAEADFEEPDLELFHAHRPEKSHAFNKED